MAKKQKPVVDTAGAQKLTHNPFAALAGAGAEPPPAPPAAATPAVEDAPGDLSFPNKVTVRREKKGRGGKTVTRVQGLPAAHREALMHRLKKTLGCGASLECGEGELSCLADLPGGLCTDACERFCPDRAGAAGTFCVDLGFSDGGRCVATCGSDADCRDGYACQSMPRYNEAAVSRSVCVPTR